WGSCCTSVGGQCARVAGLCAKFLPQTHFHARRSLRQDGLFREGVQFHSSSLPRILQRCAPRTSARMLPRRRALHFAQRSVALSIQSNRFKLLAIHLALPFRKHILFIAQRSRAAAHRETFPAWPSAKLARDAAANESSRSDTPPFPLLPHNSTLPVRTKRPLHETQRAIPAPHP